MRDFDHVADAQKVALCGMSLQVECGSTAATTMRIEREPLYPEMTIPDRLSWTEACLEAKQAAFDNYRKNVATRHVLAEAEIARLHSIIQHMAGQISALLTAKPDAGDSCADVDPWLKGVEWTPEQIADLRRLPRLQAPLSLNRIIPHKSEPEAATGAIPEPAATQVRPVPATAPACAFPESALRHGWASSRPTTDRS